MVPPIQPPIAILIRRIPNRARATPQEATTYATDALRMLVKDRTQTPEIAGPNTDAVLSTSTEEGPDLSSMVLAARPKSTSDVGFAAGSVFAGLRGSAAAG